MLTLVLITRASSFKMPDPTRMYRTAPSNGTLPHQYLASGWLLNSGQSSRYCRPQPVCEAGHWLDAHAGITTCQQACIHLAHLCGSACESQ